MAVRIQKADAAVLDARTNLPPKGLVERAAPTLFLIFWSSGFVAAKAGLEGAAPLTFLSLRFSIVTALMLAIALVLRAPWPSTRAELRHLVVLGLVIQAIYFGCSYLAFGAGITAGGLALIVGMQPVLTAVVAVPLLGERFRPVQLLGLALGVAGTALVLHEKLAAGVGTVAGVVISLMALVAITGGTLYQKRFCPRFDLWTGGTIQFATAAIVVSLAALLFEDNTVTWTPAFAAGLGYLVLVSSIVSIALLNLMLRRGEASRVATLFFLVPPGAALVAWLLLGESFGPLALVGMAVATTGVALVMRAPRRR
ncbi:MAG: DMT family transporter [Geminicoccaceae bacterium]|jgi:drug/metabolite transporter (DMT)-like permease|nr:DMT family transporter [Geminicoccaceae bacterium]MCB9968641.1 DMT family transporter [Geminicoccaceae bacterium]